jgi:hypothetical protein
VHCQTQMCFTHTVLSLTMALFILFWVWQWLIHTVLRLIMALLILFWVWQCVLLILFWVWQWSKAIINLKTVWISHCQTQNSMNKAIVKLKTVWVKHIVKLRTVWVKHIVANGFIHTVLSLTMALFILFWVWQWLYSYCFEFDNGFIHTVNSMSKTHCQTQNSMNKAIVKLKTVWIKPLSNSK